MERWDKRNTVVLSKRLQTLADMVCPGNRVADVGCDHGFLSIYLVQNQIAPKVFAMDVRKGPLAAAKEHIEACGLEDYIETRLSDGLEKLSVGEADTLVCAGMGGKLMSKILSAEPLKTASFRELILQPQSEMTEFRSFLRENGYLIVEEQILFEEGKYYFPMKAVPMPEWSEEAEDITECADTEVSADTIQHIYDTYGKILLEQKSPVLTEYLRWQQGMLFEIREKLLASGTEKADVRLAEVEKELAELEIVFGML